MVTRKADIFEIETLKDKKILAFPTGLGSTAKDKEGNDLSYIIIKINTSESGSKLKEDKGTGPLYVSDVQTGTLSAYGKIKSAVSSTQPNLNSDLSSRYGKDAVTKEKWVQRPNLTVLNRVVVLPMPSTFVVDTDIDYEDTTSEGVTKLIDVATSMGDAGAATGVMKTVGAAIAASSINALKRKLTGTSGDQESMARKVLAAGRIAMNPKKEILFKEIEFRKFAFAYELSPKNENESSTIKEIIRTLRYYALPELDEGKLFYTFPAEFEIIIMKGSTENDSIPKIASCVLESVSVNYVPTSSWNVMPDGMPPSVIMSLRFKELEIIDRSRVWNKKSKITSGY